MIVHLPPLHLLTEGIHLLILKLVLHLIWTGVYPELEDASKSLPELAASHAVDQEIQAGDTGIFFFIYTM